MTLLSKETKRKLALKLVPPIAEKWLWYFDKVTRANNNARLTIIDPDNVLQKKRGGRQLIGCFWHNRLAFGPTAYVYGGGKKGVIMISRSFDGDVIAAVTERFGVFRTARGGSSKKKHKDKGAQEAFSEMIEFANQGYDLFITPDGPQGPIYQVKRGVVDLACITGLPIYLVAANCSKCLKATSWDRTRVPLPFTKVVYRTDGPVWVPKNADEQTIEAKRQEVEKRMVEITEFVDHFYDKK